MCWFVFMFFCGHKVGQSDNVKFSTLSLMSNKACIVQKSISANNIQWYLYNAWDVTLFQDAQGPVREQGASHRGAGLHPAALSRSQRHAGKDGEPGPTWNTWFWIVQLMLVWYHCRYPSVTPTPPPTSTSRSPTGSRSRSPSTCRKPLWTENKISFQTGHFPWFRRLAFGSHGISLSRFLQIFLCTLSLSLFLLSDPRPCLLKSYWHTRISRQIRTKLCD